MQQRRSRSPSHSSLSQALRPEEDWTKISDLAERRRIQNRIAQRNYRRKLKRRLEDLERRAGSSPPSDAGSPPELSPSLQSLQPIIKEEPTTDSASPYESSKITTPELASSHTRKPLVKVKLEQNDASRHRQTSYEDSTQTLQQTYAPQIGLGTLSNNLVPNTLYSQFDEQMNNTYPSSWLLQHGFSQDSTTSSSSLSSSSAYKPRKAATHHTQPLSQPIDSFMSSLPPLTSETQEYFYGSLVPTSSPWESPSWPGASWSKIPPPPPAVTVGPGAYLASQTQLLTPPTSTNGDIYHHALSDDTTSSLDFAPDHGYRQRHYSDDALQWSDIWKNSYDEETLRRQSLPQF